MLSILIRISLFDGLFAIYSACALYTFSYHVFKSLSKLNPTMIELQIECSLLNNGREFQFFCFVAKLNDTADFTCTFFVYMENVGYKLTIKHGKLYMSILIIFKTNANGTKRHTAKSAIYCHQLILFFPRSKWTDRHKFRTTVFGAKCIHIVMWNDETLFPFYIFDCIWAWINRT